MGCGACCAFFPVAVQQADLVGPGLPPALTCFDKNHQQLMKGTQTSLSRCAALKGVVGTRVACTIYDDRPAICRNFQRSWENGRSNPLCDQARGIYGLQAFSRY
ncbi:MAG: YkgJ family cysteine cluster protein [Desulfotignum sp.]|nr:YkgJ family cysteine cluster protein [Desulfotignum sp.]